VKYLLLLVLAVFIFWYLSRKNRPQNPDLRSSKSSATPEPETMVRCAHCGVHLPGHEAVSENGDFFCSEQHRKLEKVARK
jgi:uncharacterized protein